MGCSHEFEVLGEGGSVCDVICSVAQPLSNEIISSARTKDCMKTYSNRETYPKDDNSNKHERRRDSKTRDEAHRKPRISSYPIKWKYDVRNDIKCYGPHIGSYRRLRQKNSDE